MIQHQNEFLSICRQAAEEAAAFPGMKVEHLELMMPGATVVSKDVLNLGASIFRNAKASTQTEKDA